MRINIAGAGAGKTTKIAGMINECYDSSDGSKIIYCIAYTNNAADNIERKLVSVYGYLPDRIHISTIHSFLYQELIQPYYHLLFGTHFRRISVKSIEGKYKSAEWKRLEDSGILHMEAITERAKWVFVKKSSDKAIQKAKRKVVQQSFCEYCGGIFIDEAQDINDDTFEIVEELNSLGIDITLMGDPKQDLRGYGNLKKLAAKHPDSVTYLTECYRCPQTHLELSNKLVGLSERQTSKSNQIGKLEYFFENDLSLESFLENNDYGLKYISAKTERFDTHNSNDKGVSDAIVQEIESVLVGKFPDEQPLKLGRAAYYYAEEQTKAVISGKAVNGVINRFIESLPSSIDKAEYARLATALSAVQLPDMSGKVIASSIESVKGMEASNCLFILTPDLAQYLFQKKKTDNKVKNMLYVALTRSSYKLTILISKQTENKYGRAEIEKFFSQYISV